jgi:hypothetical protein
MRRAMATESTAALLYRERQHIVIFMPDRSPQLHEGPSEVFARFDSCNPICLGHRRMHNFRRQGAGAQEE